MNQENCSQSESQSVTKPRGHRVKVIWCNLGYSIPQRRIFSIFKCNLFKSRQSQPCIELSRANSCLTINSHATSSTVVTVSPECIEVKEKEEKEQEEQISSVSPTKKQVRVILQPQSGYIESGRLTALMGPSGAGKTTLLNCITSRISDNVTGQVVTRFEQADGGERRHKVRVGFIPQKDHLFEEFTVRETLIFALKMIDTGRREDGEKLQNILSALDLTNEANNKVGKLSHGQMRRASIAVEMISSPEILFLDEPTSGLDSDNSQNVVSLLSGLCSKLGLAICCTIHQPSLQLFYRFDMVYILNRQGACIYFDSPEKLVPTLVSFGLDEPKHITAPDYAMQIANGRFGSEFFDRMSVHAKRDSLKLLNSDIEMAQLKPRVTASFTKQVLLLFSRYISARVFKSPNVFCLFTAILLPTLVFTFLKDEPTGSQDGCWSSLSSARDYEEYTQMLDNIHSNINLLFFVSCMFLFSFCFLSVVSTSNSMITVKKETENCMYGHPAYFIATTLADFLILVFVSVPNLMIFYYFTEQIWEFKRIVWFFSASILYYAIWNTKGALVGTIFYENFIVSLLASLLLQLPSLALSGFFIKDFHLFWLMKPLNIVSDTKYFLKAIVVSIYGYGRCKADLNDDQAALYDLKNGDSLLAILKLWPSFNLTEAEMQRMSSILGLSENYLDPVYEKLTAFAKFSQDLSKLGNDEEYPGDLSYVLSFWRLKDTGLSENLFILILMYCVFRVAIYFALVLKKNSRA